jgi:hypothetical protein
VKSRTDSQDLSFGRAGYGLPSTEGSYLEQSSADQSFAMQPIQLLLRLAQTVATARAHSLVCILDRTDAEDELRKLRAEYRDRLLRATIGKDLRRHSACCIFRSPTHPPVLAPFHPPGGCASIIHDTSNEGQDSVP